MKARRAVATLLVAWLASSWVLLMASPAYADDCKALVKSIKDLANPANLADCIRTGGNIGRAIGIAIGLAGIGVAVAGLPPSKVVGRKPDDKFKPRDSDECGEEIRSLDQQLDHAITQLKEQIDARTKVRMDKLDWEIKGCEARVLLAQIRGGIARFWAEYRIMQFKFVMNMGFWTSLAILTNAAGGVGKIIAGLIESGRALNFLHEMYEAYQGINLKLAGQDVHVGGLGGDIRYEGGKVIVPYTQIFEAERWAHVAEAFTEAAASVIDEASKGYDKELDQRRADLEASRANIDAMWQHRDDTYNNCLAAGNLPAGTWQRPQPSYDIDGEGAIIGVSY